MTEAARARAESDLVDLDELFDGDADSARPDGRGRAAWFVDLAVVLVATVVLGVVCEAFTGFPKGYDAYGHASKAQLLLDNWPAVNWNYAWYSGLPNFEGSYPPGYHAAVALVSAVTGTPPLRAVVLVTIAAVLVTVLSLYAFVRLLTGSRLGGLVAAGLTLAAPTFWAQVIVLGLYPRLLSFAFLAAALPVAALITRRGTRPRIAAVGVLLALSLSCHLIIGTAGAALVGAVLLLAPAADRRERLRRAAPPVLLALGLVAYFYLPFLVGENAESRFTSDNDPIPWRAFVWPSTLDLAALPFVLLPMTVGLCALLAVAVRRTDEWRTSTAEPPQSTAQRRLAAIDGRRVRLSDRVRAWGGTDVESMHLVGIIAVLVLGALAVFAYCLVGYLGTFGYYIRGLQPSDLLVYPTWLLAAACGLAIGLLGDRLRAVTPALRGVRIAAAVTVAAAVLVIVPLLPDGVRNADDPGQRATISLIPEAASGQRQHRLFGPTDQTTRATNTVSDVPQPRGYQDHGNLHRNWQIWLELALKDATTSPEQRDFLLSWYAVKWFYLDYGLSDPRESFAEFDAEPARYRLLDEVNAYTPVRTYEFLKTQPITAAVARRTVLVVGDDRHYDLVLRSLAPSGADSEQLIPIHGPAAVDDVDAELLRAVDTVVVYGATVRDPKSAVEPFRDFVRSGGGLIVDAADNPETSERLARVADSPFPVTESETLQFRNEWGFEAAEGPCTGDAPFADFGPPVFGNGGTWATVVPRRIARWAATSLTGQDTPVMVTGRYGDGVVLWSGMNLPYHAESFRSEVESAFLAECIEELARPAQLGDEPPVTAEFVSSEHRRVTVDGAARGVLVREYDHPNWSATLDGRSVPILRAGPDMMYVPLPADGSRHVVELDYALSTVERVGIALTAVTALGLVLWCVGLLPIDRLAGPVRRLGRRRRATVAE